MNVSMLIKTTLVVVMLFISVRVGANCIPATEYEQIYCTIVKRGEGQSLPRFEDFKRNDVTVQRLLLKRPATKLKITLPSSSKRHTKELANTYRAPAKSVQQNEVQQNDTQKPLKRIQEISPDNSAKGSLSQCSITKNIIACGHRRFILKKNEPNSQLLPGVLSEQYEMGLPSYGGGAGDDQEIQIYLSDVYGLYVQRMVDIGLGASTMSYSRFYHTFNDLQTKGVDFSERFETMYRFLKKDKKTMAVKSGFSNIRPTNIDSCDDISDTIIVCDMGVVNWVYLNEGQQSAR